MNKEPTNLSTDKRGYPQTQPLRPESAYRTMSSALAVDALILARRGLSVRQISKILHVSPGRVVTLLSSNEEAES